VWTIAKINWQSSSFASNVSGKDMLNKIAHASPGHVSTVEIVTAIELFASINLELRPKEIKEERKPATWPTKLKAFVQKTHTIVTKNVTTATTVTQKVMLTIIVHREGTLLAAGEDVLMQTALTQSKRKFN
jgi:hypothetical protein